MSGDWTELPFDEAIDFLLSKRPTPKDVFDAMTIEAQQKAFTASRVLKLELLQEMLDQIQDAVANGLTLPEFVASFQDSGLTASHLETIYRTNVESAYGRGSFDLLTDSDIASAIWGWRYHTVGDERVRDSHQALEGATFAMGAHDEVYPPWSYNCRCSSEAITKAEAEMDGITSSGLPAEVQDDLSNSDFASPALGLTYRPDLSGYDPGLLAHFNRDEEANR